MREKALKICQREGFVSCLNTTKWTKLLEPLNAIPCDKRVKCIDSDTVSRWQSKAWSPVPNYIEFSCGPVPFVYIEWLEIKKKASGFGEYASDKVTDRTEEIREVLSRMHLAFDEQTSAFRIYGHKRTGA